MSNSLDLDDLEQTRDVVIQALHAKLNPAGAPDESLALSGDLLAFLIEQVSIPLVVSLCASALYDILKGKMLGMMQKREAEKALKAMVGKEFKPAELSQECMKALEEQLSPLGFNREEITGLYEDLKRRLEQKRRPLSQVKPGNSPTPRIKILFLAANPIDTPSLQLDEEVRAIDQALQLSRYREAFTLEQVWAVRLEDLQESLLRYQPVIVHFSGHGTGESQLILKNDAGNGYPLLPGTLEVLFSLLKGEIRCVVLNACYSRRQAEAIARQVDCVVGMSKSISDRAAMRFSSAFYQALGYGKDVRTAFELGRLNIEAAEDRRRPHLLTTRCDPSEVVLAGNAETS